MNLVYKGVNIHYTVEGTGTAVVLLHGFLENSTMWKSVIPTLSKKHCVVCVDLLGHGQTECMGYVHSMELMAEAVKAVLKQLRIRKSFFVGHSMGGYVALAFAEKYPDNIKGLCLANSTARGDTPERINLRNRAVKVAKVNYNNLVKMSIDNLFRPKNRTIFSEEIKQLKREALKTPIQGYIAAQEGMKIRNDREALFLSSPYKKMMILGKKDPVLNYADLKAQIQHTKVSLIELPDGHMSFMENEKEFMESIIYFIDN